MSKYNYSTPTENAAIGSADREYRVLKRLARRIRDCRLSPAQEEQALEAFRGTNRRILAEVYREKRAR